TPDSFGFSRQQYPDCPSIAHGSVPTSLTPLYQLNQPAPSGIGIDKNALAILNSGVIPLPNSPFGCNYNVANLDPSDPNHCYNASVSAPTYWREELFKLDHNLPNGLKLSFRYVHDAWDTTVLTPQWSYLRTTNPAAETFPQIQNRFVGPGTNLVAQFSQVISPTLLNSLVLSYGNSTITLVDQNDKG